MVFHFGQEVHHDGMRIQHCWLLWFPAIIAPEEVVRSEWLIDYTKRDGSN